MIAKQKSMKSSVECNTSYVKTLNTVHKRSSKLTREWYGIQGCPVDSASRWSIQEEQNVWSQIHRLHSCKREEIRFRIHYSKGIV